MSNDKSVNQESQSDRLEFVIELTPSVPAEKTDLSEELVLSPSLPEAKPESAEFTLEADTIPKAEELTFEGEEDAEARIREAMIAYDKAMDDAALGS